MPDRDQFDIFLTKLESVGFVERGSDSEADILIVRNADGTIDQDALRRAQSDDVPPNDPEAIPTAEGEAEGTAGFLERIAAWARGDKIDTSGDGSPDDEFVAPSDDDLKRLSDILRARNLGEFLESQIHANFTLQADNMFGDGEMTREERIAASSAIGSALDAFRNELGGGDGASLYGRDFGLLRDGVTSDKDSGIVGDKTATPTLRQEDTDMPKDDKVALSEELRTALDAEALAYVEDLERQIAEPPKVDDPPPTPDDILRDAPPEVREMVAKANADAAAAESKAADAVERVAALEASGETERLVELAGRFHRVGSEKEIVQMLRDSSDEAATVAVLESADERIERGDLFRELGRGGGHGEAATEADGKLEALAREFMASDKDLSYEQAYARAFKENPEITAQSRDSEIKRSGR